jgi:hypothetical protein
LRFAYDFQLTNQLYAESGGCKARKLVKNRINGLLDNWIIGKQAASRFINPPIH